ncbi:MAG TPA: ABC transporter permease subunit [Bryobacteraceae bacterium]|nr:ABC transporter permease subunit [Bryobacteraceae bacterium]
MIKIIFGARGRFFMQVAGRALRSLLVLALAGLAGAALVRLAPGWDVDEAQVDLRLSRQSVERIGAERALSRNPLSFYMKYLSSLTRGEMGRSEVYGQAVAQLIGERFSVTARTVGAGLLIAWCAALLLGTAVALSDRPAVLVGATALTASALSIPAGLLAVFCLLARLPPLAAIAAIVFPRIFPHVYEQVRAGRARPYVLFGRGRGIPPLRMFLWYVLPLAAGPLIALAGVSVTLAFSASIPVEALADSAGLGQLAWKAALGRDLPVLVTITLLLTAITTLVNFWSDLLLLCLGDTAV